MKKFSFVLGETFMVLGCATMGERNEQLFLMSLRMKLCCIFASIFLLISCGSSVPFMKSACDGNLNAIQTAIKSGADINQKDESGYTALMHAVWCKQPEMAKYLIGAGADVNAKDSSGMDALLYAVDYSQIKIIPLLLEKGADIESKEGSGLTPLAHAIYSAQNLESVKLLISKGADVNFRDPESLTLIDYALSLGGRMDLVSALLDAGATLYMPSKGKARLVFVADDFFLRDGVSVTIGTQSKFIAKGMEFCFIDVPPGQHNISLPLSWYQKKSELSVNAEGDKTYFFKVVQNWGNRVAGIAAGLVGSLIVERTSDKKAFQIVPITESEAQEKIKAVLGKK